MSNEQAIIFEPLDESEVQAILENSFKKRKTSFDESHDISLYSSLNIVIQNKHDLKIEELSQTAH